MSGSSGRDRRWTLSAARLHHLPDGTDVIIETTEDVVLTPELLFGGGRPLAIEIGPGKGEFLLEMARAHPEVGFLAVEYKRVRVEKIASRVVKAGLTNVRLVWGEARRLIESRLLPSSVSALYVNFPDPWPKRRHRRRRLLSDEFLAVASRILVAGGTLTVGTDVAGYATQVVARLESAGGWQNVLGRAVIVDRLDGYATTQFEARFREQGVGLHFFRYRRLIV